MKPQQKSHYIHRTSYSFQEQIVGVFVLSALGLMLFLLFTLVKNQNLFEEYFTLYGRLNSAEGLSTETSVQVSGFKVGHVSAIEITDNNDILVTLRIYKKHHRLIRTDSVMRISSLSATVFGNSVIDISLGSPDKPLIKDGTTVQIQESISVDTVISEAAATLKIVTRMVDDVSGIIRAVHPENIESILRNINATTANVNRTTADMSAMTAHIREGKGPVGEVVYGEAAQQKIRNGLENLRYGTESLKQMMQQLNNDSRQVPVILNNMNQLIDETQKTIEATQRIWPLSSAVKQPQNKTRLVQPVMSP